MENIVIKLQAFQLYNYLSKGGSAGILFLHKLE